MSQHPLLDLASDPSVRQAAAFGAAAADLGGEQLAELYEREVQAAPRRPEAGKKYFVAYNSKLASARKPSRDSEHAAIALVAHRKATGAGLEVPEVGTLEPVHALVPLKSAQPEKERGESDPNYGVGRIDLLGVGPDSRPAVVGIRYVPPSSTRVGVGDTPLRLLLEGLSSCAIAMANRAALAAEIESAGGPPIVDEPPVLVLLGSPRYWELCRKREAQKGAAWIRQMERLATEIERDIGVTVHYLALKVEGDPGWSYPEGSPVFDSPPRLAAAWELGAGRVRPRRKPRAKAPDPSTLVVEADLSRPVRAYALTESFQAGDRIAHPTLGEGVVQGEAGRGKIQVLFGERKSLLVHARPAPAATP